MNCLCNPGQRFATQLATFHSRWFYTSCVPYISAQQKFKLYSPPLAQSSGETNKIEKSCQNKRLTKKEKCQTNERCKRWKQPREAESSAPCSRRRCREAPRGPAWICRQTEIVFLWQEVNQWGEGIPRAGLPWRHQTSSGGPAAGGGRPAPASPSKPVLP